MKIARSLAASALVVSLATPALAQTTVQAAADEAGAAARIPQVQIAPASAPLAPSGKRLVYTGAAVFVGGMATALYGFIRVGNGEFSTFGEASSRNKPLGAAGLVAAFGGGAMMFLGSRVGRYAPSQVTVNHSGFAVERTVTW